MHFKWAFRRVKYVARQNPTAWYLDGVLTHSVIFKKYTDQKQRWGSRYIWTTVPEQKLFPYSIINLFLITLKESWNIWLSRNNLVPKMSLWKGSFWLALVENQGTQININILAILITKTAKSMLSIKRTRKKDVRILRTDVTDIFENTHAS